MGPTSAASPARNEFILAPIKGITDLVHRKAIAEVFGGLDRAIAPYLRPRRGQLLRKSELTQVAPAVNHALPTIPQVLVKDGEALVGALHELLEAGHREVNLNLGCPTRNVAGRGLGSGLLPYPDRIDRLLHLAHEASPIRLSVKLRLGYQDPDDYKGVMAVLNRHPLSEVILHARTGAQMYSGHCDLLRARDAFERCAHPFVYNGDIADVAGFGRLTKELPGVSSWMVGRGVLRTPALPLLLKGGVVPAPYRVRLRDFHDQLFEGYRERLSGPKHLLDWMKGHWAYLANAFASPDAVMRGIRRARDLDSYAQAVYTAFDQPLALLENQ